MMKVGGVPLDVDIDDESMYVQQPSLDQLIDTMDENEPFEN